MNLSINSDFARCRRVQPLVSGPRDAIAIRHVRNCGVARPPGMIASSGNRDRTDTGAQSPHVSVVRGFAASSVVTRRSRVGIPFRRLPLIRIPVPGGVSVERRPP